MNENIKQKILTFINLQKEPLTLKDLSIKIGISYPTTLKYCDILLSEKKVSIKEYGKKIRLIQKI